MSRRGKSAPAAASDNAASSNVARSCKISATPPKLPSARTLLALFRNASLIVSVTMTPMALLSQIGIDVEPLIAGAGVVGLAIGFGARRRFVRSAGQRTGGARGRRRA
nr:hypothetical protein [Achromobacter anxifer]